MSAVAMFYAREVLGNAGWFAFLQLAQTVGSIIIASFVPAITLRVGKRLGYVAAASITVLAFLLIYFVPAGSLPVALAAWFLYGAGVGGSNALMFSMQADTVDYGEWKTATARGWFVFDPLVHPQDRSGVGGWASRGNHRCVRLRRATAAQTDQAIQGIRIATGASTRSADIHRDHHHASLSARPRGALENCSGAQRAPYKGRDRYDRCSRRGCVGRRRRRWPHHPPSQEGRTCTAIVTVLACPVLEHPRSAQCLLGNWAFRTSGRSSRGGSSHSWIAKTLVSDSAFDRWLRAVEYPVPGLHDVDGLTTRLQNLRRVGRTPIPFCGSREGRRRSRTKRSVCASACRWCHPCPTHRSKSKRMERVVPYGSEHHGCDGAARGRGQDESRNVSPSLPVGSEQRQFLRPCDQHRFDYL